MKIKLFKIALTVIGVLILTLTTAPFALATLQRKHFSEQSAPPEISPPIGVSTDLQPILPQNVENLREQFTFPRNRTGSVLAISESAIPDILQSVDDDGILTRWQMSSQKALATQTVFAVETESTEPAAYEINSGISFSKDGSFLITPNEVIANGIYGLNVWNTDSAKQLDCMGHARVQNCIDWGSSDDTFRSLALHPTRDLYFVAWDANIDAWYGFASGGGNGGSFTIKREEPFGTPQIMRLAMDPHGDYLAAVDVEGNIQVWDISAHKSPMINEQYHDYSAVASYRLSGSPANVTTIDLQFDPTHSWLAWLTDQQLVVWSLNNYILPMRFRTNLIDPNVLSFDRTGQLLAVADHTAILVFDVGKRTQIASFPVGDVTALYFTRDNRLLVWGDANGSIHAWGVK